MLKLKIYDFAVYADPDAVGTLALWDPSSFPVLDRSHHAIKEAPTLGRTAKNVLETWCVCYVVLLVIVAAMQCFRQLLSRGRFPFMLGQLPGGHLP